MKIDRTCQAGCWGSSVPAWFAPHPSACLEGTCQIQLLIHRKWSWCDFVFLVGWFWWDKGELVLKHGQLGFQQGTSPPAPLYQTLCSSVAWYRCYFLEAIMTISMFCFHFCHVIGLIIEVFLGNSGSKLPRLFWIVSAELCKTVWGRAKTLSLLYWSFWLISFGELEIKRGTSRADAGNLNGFTCLPEKSKKIKWECVLENKSQPWSFLSPSLQLC